MENNHGTLENEGQQSKTVGTDYMEIYCYKKVCIFGNNQFSSSTHTNKEIQVTTTLTRQANIQT